MLCGAVDVVVNGAPVWGTVKPLIFPRNKVLVGSIDEAVKSFKFDSF